MVVTEETMMSDVAACAHKSDQIACVAQSVEHFVGNEEVTGSSPVAGSIH